MIINNKFAYMAKIKKYVRHNSMDHKCPGRYASFSKKLGK